MLLGGVLPTPAAPLLLGRYGFDLAAVISASHNPYRDNGIKFFAADGYKLSDEVEARIEAALEDAGRRARSTASAACGALHGTTEDYLRALHERFAGARPDRRRRRCSTAPTAPPTRRRPRSSAASAPTVTVVADQPDGRNINDGCGSTHVAALAEQVRAGGHDVGFAFDGDGDRVLAVDRTARSSTATS